MVGIISEHIDGYFTIIIFSTHILGVSNSAFHSIYVSVVILIASSKWVIEKVI